MPAVRQCGGRHTAAQLPATRRRLKGRESSNLLHLNCSSPMCALRQAQLQRRGGGVAAAASAPRRGVAASASRAQVADAPSVNPVSIIPWALKRGVKFAKVKPAQLGAERGMVATAEIAPGDALVSVPAAAALRVTSSTPPVLGVPAALWQRLPWYGRLALLLLAEKQQGAASAFADYISVLPAHVDVPALWCDDEVAQLQAGYFIAQVQQQQAEWAQLAAQLAPYMRTQKISEQELMWALSVVRSRTFAAPAGGLAARLFKQQSDEQQQHALAPLLDMFNHDSSVQSECELDAWTGAFRVVASQPYRTGEQVFISYGESSCDALLQLYGFVEPGNAADRFVVRCIPDVLTAEGLGAHDALSELVCTRQGLPSGAAAVLEQLCSGSGSSSSSSSSPGSGTTAYRRYEELSAAARSVCAAALSRELQLLGVAADRDKQLLQRMQQPGKQRELDELRALVLQATQQLEKQQQLVEQQQQQQLVEQPPDLAVQDDGGTVSAQEQQLQLAAEQLAQLLQQQQELQCLVDGWREELAGLKRIAVEYRLAKHALLSELLSAVV